KAHTIGKQESVGSWLYKVAYRTALEVRARAQRRASREQPISDTIADPVPGDPSSLACWQELRLVLDGGVNRLPQKHRGPLALCCLGGKTIAEAARDLNCPARTVESRLARARERLRVRLVRRGFLAGAAMSALTEISSAAVLPTPALGLVTRTVTDATLF